MQKKKILTLAVLAFTALFCRAQEYNMVVSKTDNTTATIPTSTVSGMSYANEAFGEGFAWTLTVTKSDGSTEVFNTAEINNISYAEQTLADKNVDQIIIKELYNGGCQKDDGTNYQFDKCVILYNNCPQQAVINNLCFGEAFPANAQAKNENYDENGKLVYESEGFIPIWHGLWYYPHSLVIEPFSQVVVNVHGAIDNTQTVSQSVNYANKDYYCMYDPESGYNNTSYYPTPSAQIPTSHYLKAVELGLGNGWALSVSSPALIVFQLDDPASYAAQADNVWYTKGVVSQVNACIKVPVENIIDGMEVFSAGYKDSSNKRLTADIDGGYVWLTNFKGHTLYRNVDKEETEARPENAGKLVYKYSLGVDNSTDPSGIDAEASIRNGAHMVYKDTNNSSVDFHERQQCSLRD